jgi:hypothetical protein
MMSNHEKFHDDDGPRFEPWLGMIAGSVLPVAAAFYLPKSFFWPLIAATVLLFAAGLVMLKVQTARRTREREGARSVGDHAARSPDREPMDVHGAERPFAHTARLEMGDL